MDQELEKVLQRGIYGIQETKADERKTFLTSIRERIEKVLTKRQVRQAEVYPQIKQLIKEKSEKRQLLLNGSLDYRHLSKYIKLANESGMPFTIVQSSETDIGLVIAADEAIELPDIYIEEGE